MILGIVEVTTWRDGRIYQQVRKKNQLTRSGALQLLRSGIGMEAQQFPGPVFIAPLGGFYQPMLIAGGGLSTNDVPSSHGWSELTNYDTDFRPTFGFSSGANNITVGLVGFSRTGFAKFTSTADLVGVAIARLSNDPPINPEAIITQTLLDEPIELNANTSLGIVWTYQMFNPSKFSSTPVFPPDDTFSIP